MEVILKSKILMALSAINYIVLFNVLSFLQLQNIKIFTKNFLNERKTLLKLIDMPYVIKNTFNECT